MLEIESKILDISVPEVQRKLLAMGAREVFSGELKTYLIKAKNGTKLRLRKKWEDWTLTYKEPKEGARTKAMIEHNADTSSPESMLTILRAIGCTHYATNTKQRVSYILWKHQLDIDQYEGIPPLLEIEWSSEEEVIQMAQRLGYNADQCLPWTMKDLERHYGVELSKDEKVPHLPI